MKKDKQKVIGEDLSDKRIQDFLRQEPDAISHKDYYCLLRAYRALREYDFKRFVDFFVEEGRSLNAAGPEGLTLREELERHPQSSGYAVILERPDIKS